MNRRNLVKGVAATLASIPFLSSKAADQNLVLSPEEQTKLLIDKLKEIGGKDWLKMTFAAMTDEQRLGFLDEIWEQRQAYRNSFAVVTDEQSLAFLEEAWVSS